MTPRTPRQSTPAVLVAVLLSIACLGLAGCYSHVVSGGDSSTTEYEPNVKGTGKVKPLGPVSK
ncbi:MAG: hypothetical protein ACYTF9_04330 [Planctomycetota bacterium]|jgi:hypothetical protein